ncbi:Mss4-like protein [Aspergillus caelatus]|uniref:Mss4-like protein n=1 Tax=Aspergillus caelatus TaxID=61420 RepID=A0A5N7ACV6_9EURO|nr:Mss4-like protein [Aspergillus caelatus]KAE8366899.1 Mss4-like protein [Aspergillus caelatus]
MSSEPIIEETCNCGAVSVAIPQSSLPESSVACHCRNCKSSSGSLFSLNMIISTKDVTINGKPISYMEKECASGHHMSRYFCPTCGSAIMSVVSEDPSVAYVKTGLLAKSGVAAPPPGIEVWWRRAEAWEKPFAGCNIVE